ncbi:YciI family protein [Streptomyces meridianus]|uniref:YciI family protein n=1 Tax=Streptomyces meridianus TaxID=2938945 RepID=A0ABT0X0Q7_9ACTN|nr:YciI family protein [Streptomyces meridianus]MCM2576098.1 YciI family protein [Streptomyces meridianus]
MKYMMMIYAKQADYDAMSGTPTDGRPAWSEADVKAMFAHMESLNNDLAESGEWVDGQGLSEPAQARLITTGPDGAPVVTDGPYGETKEVLAGYWLLDCESIERVTEIAGRVLACPGPEGAPAYPVVVRPVPASAPCDEPV